MANDELIQFVQKAFIIHNNKLLLIQKSSKDSVNPEKWEVPGGRKKTGETLDEHIIREVQEEVGLKIVPKKIFDMWEFSLNINGKQTTVVAVARFCVLNHENIKITEDVIKDYKWVEINEDILEYDFIPNIKNVIINLVKIFKKD